MREDDTVPADRTTGPEPPRPRHYLQAGLGVLAFVLWWAAVSVPAIHGASGLEMVLWPGAYVALVAIVLLIMRRRGTR
jgi:hypothetical protein